MVLSKTEKRKVSFLAVDCVKLPARSRPCSATRNDQERLGAFSLPSDRKCVRKAPRSLRIAFKAFLSTFGANRSGGRSLFGIGNHIKPLRLIGERSVRKHIEQRTNNEKFHNRS